MSWTPERTDLLKRLWNSSLSASAIALKLGNTTRNAVIGKAHRLKLPGRPSPIKNKKIQSILELQSTMCAWPIGDPKKDDFYFCGKETYLGSPYCREHKDRAYQWISKKRSK